MNRALRLALLAGAVLAAGVGRASAQGAPADTTLEGYVRSMADSTDAWFGLSAQAPDTAGVDSALDYRLAHPHARARASWRPAVTPYGTFNRVLGPAHGADLAIGSARAFGRLHGGAMWAAGPDLWYGGGGASLDRTGRRTGSGWQLSAWAGRTCDGMDRDHAQPGIASVAALLFGADRSGWLRRDGATASLDLTGTGWRGGLEARVQREAPLATTATWSLFGRRAIVPGNPSSAEGRAHEAGAWARARLPHTPLSLDLHAWSAGGALGGDFAYTRWRGSLGGAVRLGPHLALVSEGTYGRLHGDAIPQQAFTLDGSTVRTLDARREQGSGMVATHADLILADPLQRLLHVSREPLFPLQLGAFFGAGARFGTDPASGAARRTRFDWPDPSAWRGELGVSLLYRPGLPAPDSYLRIDWAHPLGHDGRERTVVVSYTRALAFLHAR